MSLSDPEIYNVNAREARDFIKNDILPAGLVPFIRSSPGVGKSAIIRSIARELWLKMIDHRISTSDVTDFSGLPDFTDTRATFKPFDLFPLEGDPLPVVDGKQMDGWFLFFDEFNSGLHPVQAACYKLVLDWMVGQHRLHERVAMALAGNLSTDRAIVNNLSTAMQSRLVHLILECNFRIWLEDVALKEGYDERIIAFLSWKEDYLMDFDPDHQELTFCCPRTWEFMDRMVRGKDVTDRKTQLYAGTITSGKAVEFVQFCQIWKDKDMVTFADVMRDPHGAPVPQQSQRKWIITSELMTKTKEKDYTTIAAYVDRLDLSFKALFYRGLLVNEPKLRAHPQFAQAMLKVSQYLNNGDSNAALLTAGTNP